MINKGMERCKNCPKREVGCHGKCKYSKLWHLVHEHEKQKLREMKSVDVEQIEYQKRVNGKIKKKYRHYEVKCREGKNKE